MSTYSFDTSALIDGLERFYPEANFPALWTRIDELIAQGRLLISEEVWIEATRVASATRDWCEDKAANRSSCVLVTDAAIAAIAGAIVAAYPKWSTKGRKNGADPFVIAVAEAKGCVVITGEKDGGPANPKIPYVCIQRNTPHGRFVDVIRNENWRFG